MKCVAPVLLACLVAQGVSHAATEGRARICGDTICLWRRPVLATPPGWVRDETASDDGRANMFIPAGTTFSDAPAVLYGKATTRESQDETLDDFIRDDVEQTRRERADVVVVEQPGLPLADGTQVRVLSFAPGAGSQADFEAVAYFADADSDFTFVLSARNEATYRANQQRFRAFVASYVPGEIETSRAKYDFTQPAH